jgi:hypothetical protein
MLTKKTLENVHLLGEWLRLTFKGNKFDADEFNYEVLMFLGLGSHLKNIFSYV